MKGIVFTEFIEMCESKFGMLYTNELINNSDLESKGVYTSVGTYDHKEIFTLVRNLSKRTNVSEELLFNEFGKYLFDRFYSLYPVFFENIKDPFELLTIVDKHIHKEVIKLYPDAELPKFNCAVNDDELIMIYSSPREMSAFAKGLIEGCMNHFRTEHILEVTKDDEGHTRFKIIKT